MRVLEYGKEHEKTLLFLPCTAEPEWAFTASVTLLAEKYHVMQVVYDGHGETGEDFVSVEHTIDKVTEYLKKNGIDRLDAAYGCSLGGACLTRLLALGEIPVERAIIDGGITPYQMPKLLRKLRLGIDVRSFKLLAGSRRILEAAFPPERFTLPGHDSVKEYDAIERYLKTYSDKTIRNIFWSGNNFALPQTPADTGTKLVYWYGEDERKARKGNIRFIKRYFPKVRMQKFAKMEHAELMMVHPEEFCRCVERFLSTEQPAELTGVPETMLQTLYARAKESRTRGAVTDKKAEEIIEKLDYDFTLADSDIAMSSGVIARTIVLDKMVSGWLSEHPDAVVVNIACGLDTRCCRMEGFKHWYNLDLPETVAVRAKLLPEDGAISQIAMSAMDDWGSLIVENAPTLVIIEGLTMYLTQKDVQRIFEVIAGRFETATVFVETMNPVMVKRFKEKSIDQSGAKFNWGVKNGAALAELLPDFRFVCEHGLTEGMAEFVPIYKLLDKLPAVRNISNKIIVMER